MAGASGAVNTFNSIALAARGGSRVGQLQIEASGLTWRNPRVPTARPVEVPKDDVHSLRYTPVAGGGFQLSVQQNSGQTIKFAGFRGADLDAIRSHAGSNWSLEVSEAPVATSGRNWGEVELRGSSLAFVVGDRPSFEVNCADVHQVSMPTRNEVSLEFHANDDPDGEKDQLVELSFYVPPTSEKYAPPDDEKTAAKIFEERVVDLADVGPSGGEAIVEFTEISALIPRGKFSIDLYSTYAKLEGANDFKINYESILRLFLLPKPGGNQTLVVLALDPPIRKGQTRYHHVVLQMPTDDQYDVKPNVPEEMKGKFEKLEDSYSGPIAEVFCKVLRALSGCKLTKHGSFVSPNGGFAIRCAYKAEDGYLFPMEKGFFFLPKPPLLISHTEVQDVELQRHGGNLGGSAKMFDMNISLTNGSDFSFHNLQRSEFQNLVSFLTAKRVPISNLKDAQNTMAGGTGLQLDDEDHHLHHIAGEGEDSEEDEDFNEADESDDGADDESGDESDEEGGSGGEEPEAKPKPAKRKAKAEEGEPAKKKRAKKDPNAPKKGLSAFMFFSQAMRDTIKEENPDVSFGEIGKLLGERWKALDAEGKEPYEEKARKDKARYESEKAAYDAGGKAEEVKEEDDEVMEVNDDEE